MEFPIGKFKIKKKFFNKKYWKKNPQSKSANVAADKLPDMSK